MKTLLVLVLVGIAAAQLARPADAAYVQIMTMKPTSPPDKVKSRPSPSPAPASMTTPLLIKAPHK